MLPLVSATVRSLRLPVLLAGLVTLLATAFAWPASNVGPRDVPVAVTGSGAFVTRTTQALESHGRGAFDITVAPDDAAGRTMLRDNDVDGLFSETPQGLRLVLASAGRPVVADLLTSTEASLSRSNPTSNPSSNVADEVPAPTDDPRSGVFVAAALPTVLGAIAAGAILTLSRRSRADRLLGAVVIAGLTGVALTTVMHSWLGALDGGWWSLAGCYALGVGAIVMAVNGAANLFGRAGLIATAATIMLLGNPLSGATSAQEMLPSGWSTLGQVLPPGAFGSATRAVGFYDGNGASSAVLVLAAWTLVGALLLLAGPAAYPRLRRHIAIGITRDHDQQGGEPDSDETHAHLARLG
jgi:hypothetical protein